MMCPWAARIGARRSLRPASGALMDPLQPSERLHRLSRAAPALVAAPRPGARGCRLRSEGTETALLPFGVFFHRAEVPVPDCPSFIIDVVPSSSTSSPSPAPHCRSPPFCHLAYPPLLAPGARDSRSRSIAGGKRGSRGAGHGEGGDGEVCTARHEGRGKVQEWSRPQGKKGLLFTPYRKKANHSLLFL